MYMYMCPALPLCIESLAFERERSDPKELSLWELSVPTLSWEPPGYSYHTQAGSWELSAPTFCT